MDFSWVGACKSKSHPRIDCAGDRIAQYLKHVLSDGQDLGFVVHDEDGFGGRRAGHSAAFRMAPRSCRASHGLELPSAAAIGAGDVGGRKLSGGMIRTARDSHATSPQIALSCGYRSVPRLRPPVAY